MPATKISLRERKFAKTRLGLLKAAVEEMQEHPLEEISVKGLCEAVMVSEATFFNYFPRKTDLLTYYQALWTLELAWYGSRAAEANPGLAAITAVFRQAGQKIQSQPGVMGELIAYQARLRERPDVPEITHAERMLAFPELRGIDEMESTGLDQVLVPNLQYAIERGELPANTPLHATVVALVSLFYGVPLALLRANPQGIGSAYAHQLNLMWAGVRAASGTYAQ